MSGETDAVSLSLDLLRRLPPAQVTQNVEKLVKVLPNQADDITASVDQPLGVRVDTSREGAGREYLCCDYNRDGESWRSWYSNTYDPPLEDAVAPTGKLRELEIRANDAFETYRQLYYETGFTSTYLWDVSGDASGDALPASFAGVVLFKKDLGAAADSGSLGTHGCWDSLHVFEVDRASEATSKSAHYKLTSTVMLTLDRRQAKEDTVDLSGSIQRQAEQVLPVNDNGSHVVNMGRMVEDLENKIRNQLQEVYFGKTRDVLEQMRSLESLEAVRNTQRIHDELVLGWRK